MVHGKWLSLNVPITEPYDGVIRGYGEIYEMVSVERVRKHLLKKYGEGYPEATLFLMPFITSPHPFEGHSSDNTFLGNILEMGNIDRPPWKSNPRDANPRKLSGFQVTLSRLSFKFMVLFENWLWNRRYEPHMEYILFNHSYEDVI